MLFFFDTDDGGRRFTDDLGIELPSEAEAVEQALALLRDLSHGGVIPGASREISVRVRGAGDEALYAARLRLTVESLR